jgi:hypothetical protein
MVGIWGGGKKRNPERRLAFYLKSGWTILLFALWGRAGFGETQEL